MLQGIVAFVSHPASQDKILIWRLMHNTTISHILWSWCVQETLNFINNNRQYMTQSKTAIPKQKKGFPYEKNNFIWLILHYYFTYCQILVFQQKVSS